MDIGITSSRYAKALFRFASENNEEEQVYTEMNRLAEVFLSLPALQQALVNPTVSDEQKTILLETASQQELPLSTTTRRFFVFVIRNKRAELMTFIASSYIDLYRKSKKFIKGRLTIPAPVSEETQNRLKAIIEQKSKSNVEFEVRIDASIGGGFILEYDTYQMDASVRTQLNKLQRALKN